MNTYTLIRKGYRMVAVKSEMEKPSKESCDFNGGAVYNGKHYSYEEAIVFYNNHLHSLPEIQIPDDMQGLPEYSEVKGEVVWQVEGINGSWSECSERYYMGCVNEYRRLFLVPITITIKTNSA